MASKPFTTMAWAVVGKSGSEWIASLHTHRNDARNRCRDLNRMARGTGHRFITRSAKLSMKLDRRVRLVR